VPLHVEIITVESVIYSDDVDMVVAPGVEGSLGILPHHAPLFTMLQTGEAKVKKGTDEQHLMISGGFLEVSNNRVTILADVAVRAEDIDVAAAEAARQRALEDKARGISGDAAFINDLALRRSLTALNVARRRRNRPGMGSGDNQ
jgi:F-type H+-transporting ATPase subunit epsilon